MTKTKKIQECHKANARLFLTLNPAMEYRISELEDILDPTYVRYTSKTVSEMTKRAIHAFRNCEEFRPYTITQKDGWYRLTNNFGKIAQWRHDRQSGYIRSSNLTLLESAVREYMNASTQDQKDQALESIQEVALTLKGRA